MPGQKWDERFKSSYRVFWQNVIACVVSNQTAMSTSSGSTRLVALKLMNSVLRHRQAFDHAVDCCKEFSVLSSRDRAFVWLLVATCFRRLGQIDRLIARCISSPLPRAAWPVNDMLRLGVAQILFLSTPPHAAVDTTVNLASGRMFRYRKLINAVLRRLVREGIPWRESQDAERLNTPDWLWKSWCGAYGEPVARQIAAAHLREAPLDITAKNAPSVLVELLGARLLPTGTLRVEAGGPVAERPGFAEGQWWVQDAAAALPVALLGEIANARVIDLCAAPGGKTAQLCSRGADVVAVDRSRSRLQLLERNLDRLRLSAQLVNEDVVDWQPCSPAKYVLLDAPCSATGTIRRHPEILHLKSPDDVERAVVVQEQLLDAAVTMLAPGGILVFSTCSLQPEEGLERVENLLARRPELERSSLLPKEREFFGPFLNEQGDLRTLPTHLAEEGGLDGFYAARLKRKR